MTSVAKWMLFILIWTLLDDEVHGEDFVHQFREKSNKRRRSTVSPVSVSNAKRSPFQGYLAFMLLCEPDPTCVPDETKLSIVRCFESGQSLAAVYLYKQCTAQGTVVCQDDTMSRTVRTCLRLQSGSGHLITDASRHCIRQKVTLANLDCYHLNAKLRERGTHFWAHRVPSFTPVSGIELFPAPKTTARPPPTLGSGEGQSVGDPLANGYPYPNFPHYPHYHLVYPQQVPSPLHPLHPPVYPIEDSPRTYSPVGLYPGYHRNRYPQQYPTVYRRPVVSFVDYVPEEDKDDYDYGDAPEPVGTNSPPRRRRPIQITPKATTPRTRFVRRTSVRPSRATFLPTTPRGRSIARFTTSFVPTVEYEKPTRPGYESEGETDEDYEPADEPLN